MIGISQKDLSFVFSGGSGNLDPSQSLGGNSSAYPLKDGINNLFDDVQLTGNTITDYRCFYVFNDNETQTLFNVAVWIDNSKAESDIAVAVGGLDTVATYIGNKNNPPNNVVFSYPTSQANSIFIGQLQPLDGFYVWVRRTISANSDQKSDDSVSFVVQGVDQTA